MSVLIIPAEQDLIECGLWEHVYRTHRCSAQSGCTVLEGIYEVELDREANVTMMKELSPDCITCDKRSK